MYKTFSVMLIALAVSTPAHADIFGWFASDETPEPLVDGYGDAPMQSTIVDGTMHGYPFYSGCCEPKSSCCERLWDGFCESRGGGMKHRRPHHHQHLKGDCGCDAGYEKGYGRHHCDKGDCGHAGPFGHSGKLQRGYLNYRGLGKSGYGFGGGCGGKGCADECGPKHARLGLFDRMHFGQRHACTICGDVGCPSCGKGGYLKGGPIQGSAVQQYDRSYYGNPTEVEENSTLQPPEVLVEPSSVSDRSAWRRPVPAREFAWPIN